MKAIGLDTQPTPNLLNVKGFEMKQIINWKTTTVGIIIFLVKTFEGIGIIPPNIFGINLLATLTMLLGIVAGDATQSKKV